MKKIVIALASLAFVAAASALERPGNNPGAVRPSTPAARPPVAVTPPSAAEPMPTALGDWKPRKVTKPDSKGIDSAYAIHEELMKRADVDAWAALINFPIYMVTDTAAGVPSANAIDKAGFLDMMRPMMANMPKDVKVTTKHKLEFITDTIAIGIEDHTMMAGKQKFDWRSSTLWFNVGGKWMAKSMIEGGWGDLVKPPKVATPAAAPAATPAAAPAAAPAKTPAPK